MAATGGTPAQARRVVLAAGVVLGAVAALAGRRARHRRRLAAAAARPALVGHAGSGRSTCRWRHLAGVAAFGLLSALLAAVVPGLARLPAGRRGRARRASRRPRAVAALADARAGAARRRHRLVGVRRDRRRGGEPLIAVGAIVVGARHDPAGARSWSVGLARLSGGCRCRCGTPSATPPGTAPAPCPRSPRWPRPWPAWSRSGIGMTSDEAENRGDVPARRCAMGARRRHRSAESRPPTWPRRRRGRAAGERRPRRTVVRGSAGGRTRRRATLDVELPASCGDRGLLDTSGRVARRLVWSRDSLPAGRRGWPGADRDAADAALAGGAAGASSPQPSRSRPTTVEVSALVDVRRRRTAPASTRGARPRRRRSTVHRVGPGPAAVAVHRGGRERWAPSRRRWASADAARASSDAAGGDLDEALAAVPTTPRSTSSAATRRPTRR